MTQRPVTTKAELLAAIAPSWSKLNKVLEQLSETQMTVPRDRQGWTVKDHLVHMTAWEHSMVFLLQSKPRHEGLGVDESIYLQGPVDEVNTVIFQQGRDLPLADVLLQLQNTHQALMTLLEPLTDADLNKRYRHYLPDEPGDGDGPPVINLIYGNTADHFAEHLGWIESLAGTTGLYEKF